MFDGEGVELGTVRGITDDGFLVSTREGIEALSGRTRALVPGDRRSRAHVALCRGGEMGDIADIPPSCPNCGAPPEDIYYYVDDDPGGRKAACVALRPLSRPL